VKLTTLIISHHRPRRLIHIKGVQTELWMKAAVCQFIRDRKNLLPVLAGGFSAI
jgi:hypothetical protein